MADVKSFYVHLNLNGNEIRNFRVQVLAEDPDNPFTGQLYFNSTTGKLRSYDGSSWVEYGTGNGTGETNLSVSRNGTSVTVASDTGNDAVLPAASGTEAGVMTAADKSKLDGIESGADQTDSTNVDAAGAVMNSDTSTAGMGFVVDEDDMVSNSATKVPTQQSVKAYTDARVAALVNGAPGTLDTLEELAAALGDDPNLAATIASQIGALDARLDAIEADGGVMKGYATLVGDGTNTDLVVTHNLGTKAVNVSVYDVATDEEVEVGVHRTSTSQVTITATPAVGVDALSVVVMG